MLQDVLSGLGAVKVQRMFGGHGVYLDGVFFAILDDGVLYFKVSDTTRSAFETEGMGPFTYQTKHGIKALKSYWRVPERLFDEPDELIEWASAAVTAARRAKANPKSKKSGAIAVAPRNKATSSRNKS